jgi:hypothetical protein
MSKRLRGILWTMNASAIDTGMTKRLRKMLLVIDASAHSQALP